MTGRIECIRERAARRDAERIVGRLTKKAARVERALYYPYVWCRARYSLATLFGRPRFEIDCLVDARRSVVSTSDPLDTVALAPHRDDVLEALIDTDAALPAARRALGHLLAKRHRTLQPLVPDMTRPRLLYKKFWVVRCGGSRVLVDSATGRFIGLGQTVRPVPGSTDSCSRRSRGRRTWLSRERHPRATAG